MFILLIIAHLRVAGERPLRTGLYVCTFKDFFFFFRKKIIHFQLLKKEAYFHWKKSAFLLWLVLCLCTVCTSFQRICV